jgi:hypothetical protein
MTVWVGVIAALSGALVSGGLLLLNARLQFKQQVARERHKLLLSKLEELHEVIARVRRSYESSTVERINAYLNVETCGREGCHPCAYRTSAIARLILCTGLSQRYV